MSRGAIQTDVRYRPHYSQTAKNDGDPLRIAELYGPERHRDQSTRAMVEALRSRHAAGELVPIRKAIPSKCPRCDGEGCQSCGDTGRNPEAL